MGYTNRTQLVRFHIQWTKNIGKVLHGMNITTGPNQFNMVEHMCSGIILTLFQSKVQKQCKEQQMINANAARTAEPP